MKNKSPKSPLKKTTNLSPNPQPPTSNQTPSLLSLILQSIIFLLLLIPFLSSTKDQKANAKEEGIFQDVTEVDEAEEILIKEIDQIFAKALEKLADLTVDQVDEEEACFSFDHQSKAITYLSQENTRTECVAEGAISLIEKFRERIINLQDQLEKAPEEKMTFYNMFSRQGKREEKINQILSNVNLALRMSLENYDIIRRQKLLSIQGEKEIKLLKDLLKETGKVKSQTKQIKEKIIPKSTNIAI